LTTVDTLGAMERLREANELLDDHERLRRRLDDEGYLFFREVIDTAAIDAMRDSMLAILAEHGIVEPGSSESVWTGKQPERSDPVHELMYGAAHWRTLVADPSFQRLCERVFGEAAFWLDRTTHRYTPPTSEDPSRPSHGKSFFHQDAVGLYGLRCLTFWVPLMAIGETLGGLAVAPRTHALGMLHHGPTLDISAEDIPRTTWFRADYRPGDALLMDPMTVHVGLPNRSPDRVRLSVDMRAQPVSDPRPAFLSWTAKENSDFTRIGRGILVEEGVPDDLFEPAFFRMRDRQVDLGDRDAVRAVIAEAAGGPHR